MRPEQQWVYISGQIYYSYSLLCSYHHLCDLQNNYKRILHFCHHYLTTLETPELLTKKKGKFLWIEILGSLNMSAKIQSTLQMLREGLKQKKKKSS